MLPACHDRELELTSHLEEQGNKENSGQPTCETKEIAEITGNQTSLEDDATRGEWLGCYLELNQYECNE